MSRKKLLLVRFETFGLFLNTLTSDDKYSRNNREKFPQQIKMQLSQTLKSFFFLFCIALLQSASNFEYLEKKDESDG